MDKHIDCWSTRGLVGAKKKINLSGNHRWKFSIMTDAMWVLPNPVGKQTNVFYVTHFIAIEYWYYRNYGYSGYMNGPWIGFTTGYNPEDRGTFIFGITFEFLLDELSLLVLFRPLIKQSKVWLLRLALLFWLRHLIYYNKILYLNFDRQIILRY